MASRGSFQKHKKEQARKEKRQQKIDRRQGRTVVPPHSLGSQADGEPPIQSDDGLTAEVTNTEHADQPGANPTVADDHRDSRP